MPTLEILRAFAQCVADNYGTDVDAQPEDQLKRPIQNLLEGLGDEFEKRVTEVDPNRWTAWRRLLGGIPW